MIAVTVFALIQIAPIQGVAPESAQIEKLILSLRSLAKQEAESTLETGTRFIFSRPPLLGQDRFEPSQYTPGVRRSVAHDLIPVGAPAIPALVASLSDRSPIGDFEAGGPFAPSFEQSEAYDWNRKKARTSVPPEGLQFMGEGVRNYQLTVGDMAYFALGQIVNRAFVPVCFAGKYTQITAPSVFPNLATHARLEWGTLASKGLLESLEFDVFHPDEVFRDSEAIYRLRLYFPKEVERIVLKKLPEEFKQHKKKIEELSVQPRRWYPGWPEKSVLHALKGIKIESIERLVLREFNRIGKLKSLDPYDRSIELDCAFFLADTNTENRSVVAQRLKLRVEEEGIGQREYQRALYIVERNDPEAHYHGSRIHNP